MYPHLLKIQIAMLLLVCLAGFVLGNSLGDLNIAWMSILGAIAAFVIVDRLELIELSGWVANVVSIFIFFYAMRDFVGGNSSAKLVAVANLLAYLQIALFFQKKTPRLCWQVIVLSILQMVVAAIFNLNFEFGLFFLSYFAVATVAMILQTDFSQWHQVLAKNKENLHRPGVYTAALTPPMIVAKLQPNQNLSSTFRIVVPWLAVSIIFAFVLFHSLPHSRQEWKGPAMRKFIGTGKSVSVNLDENGVVALSSSLIFRAKFVDRLSGKNILMNEHPYFRGIALNKLVLDNDTTSWKAPYDHVFAFASYSRMGHYSHSQKNNGGSRPVLLEIVLEPTSDPLLYSTMPAFRGHSGGGAI